MKNVLFAWLVIAAPAVFAAPPTVTITATETVITVTPGASVAVVATSSNASGQHAQSSSVERDTDNDGVIRIARTTSASLTRHAVLVADRATGETGYATLGAEPSLAPLPLGSVLMGPTGAFTIVALPHTAMEMIWLRPGFGSWRHSFNGVHNVLNGFYVVDITGFNTMTAPAPARPAAFQRGDVLLVLDRQQRALAGPVDANIEDTSHGIVSFEADETGTVEGRSVAPLGLFRFRNTSGEGSVRVTAGGSAVAGVHYEPFDPVVRFAPGDVVKPLAIRTIDDQVWGRITFLDLELVEDQNLKPGTTPKLRYAITDNDPVPELALEPLPAQITETDADSVMTVAVTKRNATRETATVTAEWRILRAGVVIASGKPLLTFAPGDTVRTFSMRIPGSPAFEGSRTIMIELKNEQFAMLGDNSGKTIALVDDELPVVAASGGSVREGLQNAIVGAVKALFGTGTAGSSISLKWRTVDGTAKAGSDYTPASGTIEKFDGHQYLTIQTLTDEVIEGDEFFYIEIYEATNAGIVNGRAEVVISDHSYPEVRIPTVTVVEGGPGARTNAVVRLSFSRPTVFPSVLSLVRSRELYSLPVAGSDYDGSWEGVPIYVPQGQSSVDVIIPILGDGEAEGDEVLFLQTGLLLGFRGTQGGRLTIQNDDPGPAVTHVRVAGGGDPDEGPNRSAYFAVGTFDRKPGPLSVSWRTEDGTAIAGQDYVAASGTLEFSAIEHSKDIYVQLIDDGNDENDETFSVVIHSPVNATMDSVRATATIHDNDLPAAPPPHVEVDDITAGEKDGAATFTLRLSAAWPVPVIVQYSTRSTLQTLEADYVPVTGSVTFAPGERTKTIAVPILDDPFYDPNERIQLVLTSGIAVVPSRVPVLTIDDDEPSPKRRASRH